MMPGIDGGEVANILRSEITTQHKEGRIMALFEL